MNDYLSRLISLSNLQSGNIDEWVVRQTQGTTLTQGGLATPELNATVQLAQQQAQQQQQQQQQRITQGATGTARGTPNVEIDISPINNAILQGAREVSDAFSKAGQEISSAGQKPKTAALTAGETITVPTGVSGTTTPPETAQSLDSFTATLATATSEMARAPATAGTNVAPGVTAGATPVENAPTVTPTAPVPTGVQPTAVEATIPMTAPAAEIAPAAAPVPAPTQTTELASTLATATTTALTSALSNVTTITPSTTGGNLEMALFPSNIATSIGLTGAASLFTAPPEDTSLEGYQNLARTIRNQNLAAMPETLYFETSNLSPVELQTMQQEFNLQTRNLYGPIPYLAVPTNTFMNSSLAGAPVSEKALATPPQGIITQDYTANALPPTTAWINPKTLTAQQQTSFQSALELLSQYNITPVQQGAYQGIPMDVAEKFNLASSALSTQAATQAGLNPNLVPTLEVGQILGAYQEQQNIMNNPPSQNLFGAGGREIQRAALEAQDIVRQYGEGATMPWLALSTPEFTPEVAAKWNEQEEFVYNEAVRESMRKGETPPIYDVRSPLAQFRITPENITQAAEQLFTTWPDLTATAVEQKFPSVAGLNRLEKDQQTWEKFSNIMTDLSQNKPGATVELQQFMQTLTPNIEKWAQAKPEEYAAWRRQMEETTNLFFGQTGELQAPYQEAGAMVMPQLYYYGAMQADWSTLYAPRYETLKARAEGGEALPMAEKLEYTVLSQTQKAITDMGSTIDIFKGKAQEYAYEYMHADELAQKRLQQWAPSIDWTRPTADISEVATASKRYMAGQAEDWAKTVLERGKLPEATAAGEGLKEALGTLDKAKIGIIPELDEGAMAQVESNIRSVIDRLSQIDITVPTKPLEQFMEARSALEKAREAYNPDQPSSVTTLKNAEAAYYQAYENMRSTYGTAADYLTNLETEGIPSEIAKKLRPHQEQMDLTSAQIELRQAREEPYSDLIAKQKQNVSEYVSEIDKAITQLRRPYEEKGEPIPEDVQSTINLLELNKVQAETYITKLLKSTTGTWPTTSGAWGISGETLAGMPLDLARQGIYMYGSQVWPGWTGTKDQAQSQATSPEAVDVWEAIRGIFPPTGPKTFYGSLSDIPALKEEATETPSLWTKPGTTPTSWQTLTDTLSKFGALTGGGAAGGGAITINITNNVTVQGSGSARSTAEAITSTISNISLAAINELGGYSIAASA